MKQSWSHAHVRLIAGQLALFLTIGVLALMPGTARADSAPPAPSAATPTTVTADGLPTVQINGVAWSQVVLGNTVYVAGSFTSARPAGAAAGTQETPRNNLLAYDIRSGNLITSFAPSLNGQALIITASPDGQRLYVGGDFTQVNGQTRNRVAALTPAGALVAGWAPSVSSQVRGIAATNDTVYLGGSISAVGNVSRNRLAAVTAATGALLPWAPQPGVGDPSGNRNDNFATSNQVLSIVLTNGGTQVVAAGRFDSLNGVKATGVGALDAVTGATRPFAVNSLITNQGINSAIYSLTVDAAGTTVYGTAYDFYGPGNLEGSFAATADGGAVVFINACHGDTYSSWPMNGVLYMASHAHECSPIGGYAEQDPQIHMFATAVTLAATRKVQPPELRGIPLVGQPAPSLLDWFPTMSSGTFTGQGQAGWSVSGNAEFVVFGGEFPRVNGVGQQGLVRYAMSSNAPNRVGPSQTDFTATAASFPGGGAARISWLPTSDQDNEYLTYRLYRDGNTTTPIDTRTQASTWWNRPSMVFSDTGISNGQHTYRVSATDPFGNRVNTPWATVDVAARDGQTTRSYDTMVFADGAYHQWSLGEQSGATVVRDHAGTDDLPMNSGVTLGRPGAISGDSDTAAVFDGTSNGFIATQTPVQGPQVFSVETWFQTTTTTGGKLVGFGDSKTATNSAARDRHMYMDAQGHLLFGTYTGARSFVTSPAVYNDGKWHHAVATLGPNGMFLYVDGGQVGARPEITFAQDYSGYWRIGGDGGWAGDPWFDGTIDEVALYSTVLTPAQVANHFSVGSTGGPANAAPTAEFSATPTGRTVAFDANASDDSDGTIASYTWDFGDGGSSTGPSETTSHPYLADGTYTVKLTVTDNHGATATASHDVAVAAPPANKPPTAAFTSTVTDLTAAFDTTGSGDEDGTIAAYVWDFGDTKQGTGAAPSHTYGQAGTYPVTLTVTDDDGATGTTTANVTVTAPAGPPVLADDTFDRTVTGGLGTAPTGGPWTVSAGAARQSVASGIATLALPGANGATGSYLGGISQTDVNVVTSFSVSSTPTGSGTYVYLTGRRIGANEYRIRARLLPNGTVALALSRLSGGTEAFPGGETVLSGVTFVAGAPISLRMQVSGSGPTAISTTVWRTGTAEPAPQRTWSDTTAGLQAPGSVGLTVHRPSNTTAATEVRVADFRATGAGGGGTPANTPPSPSFTATPTGLNVAVDASASTDDGTITTYAWNWGDSSPATSGAAATANHTYAAGAYTITLTATDNAGATATATRNVTVSAPTNPPPTAAFTTTVNGRAVTFDASGSTDNGSVTGWSWTFGDGLTSTAGPTVTHNYGAAGTYPVTLRVTDNQGATGDTSGSVVVADTPGPAVLVNDVFDRTASNGLGNANAGGAWTASAGPTRQSVTPGAAELTLPAAGNATGSYVGSGIGDANILTTFSLSAMPTGSGTYLYVTGRRVSTGNEYRIRVRVTPTGQVYLALSRLVGGTEAFPGGEVVVPGVTYTAGSSLSVRVVVSGSGSGTTQLATTVWAAGATEPAAPQVTRADTTAALQGTGALGLTVHRPTGTTAATTVRFTSFKATALA